MTRRRPGSQGALRAANEARVADVLRDGPATQSELADRTGLANATVSNIVKDLRERGSVSTSPTVHGGRRATLVTLEAQDGPTVVGVDFGRRHVRIAIARTDLQPLAEDSVALPAGHHASESLAVAATRLDELLEEVGLDRGRIAGTCVGVPGPIDMRTGTIAGHTILPEWVGVSQDRVAEALGLPVEVANDADLGAIAERTAGAYRGVDDLMFVKVGTGIGTGLVLGGRLHRGSIGIAGELGHVQVDPQGPLCVCGNRGCLETLASVRIMTQELSAALRRPVTTADIVEGALGGDPVTRRVIEDAGAAIGRATANAANLLAPSVIVVGGPLVAVGDLLLDPVRDGFRRFAIHALAESTEIVASSLGERAEVLGALVLARDGARVTAFM
ncbi:ROK family transcriptional regulator [Agrococcus versicolor]|uniref:ROK family transcriptional regulator n=1 Tax=Agrococcus versicolor TaxID=501482 RepID=A0ABP5MI70_9MICO